MFTIRSKIFIGSNDIVPRLSEIHHALFAEYSKHLAFLAIGASDRHQQGIPLERRMGYQGHEDMHCRGEIKRSKSRH